MCNLCKRKMRQTGFVVLFQWFSKCAYVRTSHNKIMCTLSCILSKCLIECIKEYTYILLVCSMFAYAKEYPILYTLLSLFPPYLITFKRLNMIYIFFFSLSIICKLASLNILKINNYQNELLFLSQLMLIMN